MNPLHFCIAVVPIAAYLLLIGWINLRRSAFVTTGVRDLAGLSLAIAGLMIAGPMELFLPESVASRIGGWVWVPLISFYTIIVTLVLLLARPRLVIYNTTSERLRPVLKEVIHQMDSEARWAGDSVVLPQQGIHLAIDAYPGIRNVTLAAVGPEQNLDGWARLRSKLAQALADVSQPPNFQGVSFLALSVVLVIAVVYSLFTGRLEIAQSFRQMMRL